MRTALAATLAGILTAAGLAARVAAQGPAAEPGGPPAPAQVQGHGNGPQPGHMHGQPHGHDHGRHHGDMHGHHHGPHGGHAHGAPSRAVPSMPGQDAFGAIAEIVAILEADPTTDWTRVDLERLRRHLVDMNVVVLGAEVASREVPGGLVMDVTGSGRVAEGIRNMLPPHARELDAMPDLAARVEPIEGGVRLTVTAADPADARAVARVRGLGFAGLLTLGAHHQAHHLAMARGEALPGHGH